MVFQSYALYPTMTARENITFGMESRGVPKPEQDEAVKRVAALLQIEPLLDRKPGQLSGGQRQRVAMGRALVRDPKLFLFDEPLSNLDAKLRVDMRTEIKKLHHRVGKTTIYVTHDQVEAMTLASRIAVMHQGEVQQFDEPQAVYDRPANMFVAGFMGSPAMNFIPAELRPTSGGPACRCGWPMATPPTCRSPERRAGRRRHGGARHPPRAHLPARSGTASAASRASRRSSAPVEVVEPTGAETIAVLRLGAARDVGRFDPDDAPRMGETMPLGIDMARACLFDPATQRLI